MSANISQFIGDPGVFSETPRQTVGDFADEKTSAESFDQFSLKMQSTGVWDCLREVSGHYISSLPFEQKGLCRIDRIIMPKKKLIDAGWSFGPIGVEIKRSGEKLGRPASQCLDYRHAAFLFPDGHQILLRQIFLWPLRTWGGGELESVMAQKRIGGCYENKYKMSIDFYLGQQMVLRIKRDGFIEEVKKDFIEKLGRKKGNR